MTSSLQAVRTVIVVVVYSFIRWPPSARIGGAGPSRPVSLPRRGGPKATVRRTRGGAAAICPRRARVLLVPFIVV